MTVSDLLRNGFDMTVNEGRLVSYECISDCDHYYKYDERVGGRRNKILWDSIFSG